jgi:acyl-CoA thioesterase
MSAEPDAVALARRVQEAMLARDAFSQWLGLEILHIAPAACTVRMTVRHEMLNGFGVAHGAIAFAVADSAFAFACNTQGRITYPAAVRAGDVLTAEAREEAASERLGYYAVRVTNGAGAVVGLFRGTSYRTRKEHFPAGV